MLTTLMWPYLQLGLGLVLLFGGGEALVRGAIGIADRLNISPMVTGLVLVGFGTSMPELVTSLKAALEGSPGLSLGNVVGSNIANILLILGITALIYPIAVDPRSLSRDATVLAAATFLSVLLASAGTFSRFTGSIFIILLIIYVAFEFVWKRGPLDPQDALHAREAATFQSVPHAVWMSSSFAVFGIILLIVGADVFVEGAVKISLGLGVSETIIGLTVVAVGTSLPELTSSIVAALRKQTDIAFGNIVGSNIFNLLGIIGVTALVAPIMTLQKLLLFDLVILLLATVLILIFAFTGARIARREGVVLLTLYAAYVGFQLARVG